MNSCMYWRAVEPEIQSYAFGMVKLYVTFAHTKDGLNMLLEKHKIILTTH